MTKREKEILSWISENPMISQQEIAERANITRSSVAVHISNLMKKGKIIGKGYVVQKDSYVCVIGAVNVDITGTSGKPLVDGDSNPGKVNYRFGGVGRNIAENLCLLGKYVEMITVLGDDIYAGKLKQHCHEVGIELSHSMMIPGKNTSTYLCINDADGDMRVAISDMEIYDSLTSDYLRSKLDMINRSSLVVIDCNLSEEALKYLFTHVSVPMFVDTVSTIKAMKIKPYLSAIHTLKPNRIEAELLSGIKIKSDRDLNKAARFFLDAGIKQIFISLGANGVYYADGKHHGKLPNQPGKVVNTTGCGDSFMAAVAYANLNQYTIERSATLGLRASALTASAETAVNEKMNADYIENNKNGGN